MSEDNILDEKSEKVNFDIKFQMAILKMMFYDDHFCSQMTRFLGGDDKELNKYVIFETEGLHIIFKTMTGLFKEFSVRPSPPAVRQTVVDSKWTGHKTAKDEVLQLIDKINDMQLLDDKYYRQHMTTFIKNIKIRKSLEVFKEENKKDSDKIPSLMQTRLDDINRVSFEAESLMTLKMIPKLIEESAQSMGRAIPTGIKELDKDLHGGLPRDSLIVVLSGTNVGKSMFCISAGAQSLKAVDNKGENLGLKVLMIPLEGQKQESIMRFASCLTGIEFGKLINNLLSDEERAILKKTLEEFDETRLQVLNMLDFNVTVESLMAVCAEKYKEFKFDVLIVDYGQLLSTVQQTEGHRFTMAVVFRGLAALARKFNCVVMSPAQATRQGQENLTESNPNRRNNDKLPVLRSADISEAFEIARVAGVILSLNMTDEERAEKKLRVFLEKQRHGVKDKVYGLITDYSRCNLITGQVYNPRSNMMDVSALDAQLKVDKANSSATVSIDSGAPKKETFSLASWFGEGSSLDQLANRQKLSGLIDLIKNNRLKMKAKIEEMQQAKEEDPFTIQDEGSIFFTLRSEYEDLEQESKKSIVEFKELFESSYPGSKKENIEILTQMSTKQKESGAKAEEIKKIEDMITRFQFRYTDAELKEVYGE